MINLMCTYTAAVSKECLQIIHHSNIKIIKINKATYTFQYKTSVVQQYENTTVQLGIRANITILLTEQSEILIKVN